MIVKFNITITDRIINNIIEQAIDRMKQWCDEVEYMDCLYDNYMCWEMININNMDACSTIIEHIQLDETIKLHDKRNNRKYQLTHKKIIKGIQRYLRRPVSGDFLKFTNGTLKVNIASIDEGIADAILQYAIFNKVIYE